MQKIQVVKDVSDHEIAERLGLSRQRINQIKASLAQGRAVRNKTVHKLARALEVDVQTLIDLG